MRGLDGGVKSHLDGCAESRKVGVEQRSKLRRVTGLVAQKVCDGDVDGTLAPEKCDGGVDGVRAGQQPLRHVAADERVQVRHVRGQGRARAEQRTEQLAASPQARLVDAAN